MADIYNMSMKLGYHIDSIKIITVTVEVHNSSDSIDCNRIVIDIGNHYRKSGSAFLFSSEFTDDSDYSNQIVSLSKMMVSYYIILLLEITRQP